MPAPPTRGTQQSGTALAVTQIRAGYISQSSAHKNVRRKMLLRWIARETYTRGKRVSAPFKPSFMRITVRDNRREGKTRRSVPGGERPSTGPEFSGAIPGGGKLTIKRQFQSQVHSARSAHGRQRLKARVAKIPMIVAAAYSISNRAGSKLHAKAYVRPKASGLLK